MVLRSSVTLLSGAVKHRSLPAVPGAAAAAFDPAGHDP
jgi:hypothetical protein